MPEFVDTHCHLNLDQFASDSELVISQAMAVGVKSIIIPGVDIQTSQAAIDLAEKYDGVYAAIGFHPSEANNATPKELSRLKKMASAPKVVAVGEIGLDFYHDSNPSEGMQKEAFLAQLSMAYELDLPVILHSREALPQVMRILNTSKTIGGVFHAFEGDVKAANQAVSMGFMIGIGGPVTYTNAIDKQILAKECPLGSLVLETDAPYLAPKPHRQERNQPAWLPIIAEKVAELRQEPVEFIAQQTSQNARILFLRSKVS